MRNIIDSEQRGVDIVLIDNIIRPKGKWKEFSRSETDAVYPKSNLASFITFQYMTKPTTIMINPQTRNRWRRSSCGISPWMGTDCEWLG